MKKIFAIVCIIVVAVPLTSYGMENNKNQNNHNQEVHESKVNLLDPKFIESCISKSKQSIAPMLVNKYQKALWNHGISEGIWDTPFFRQHSRELNSLMSTDQKFAENFARLLQAHINHLETNLANNNNQNIEANQDFGNLSDIAILIFFLLNSLPNVKHT